MTIETRFTCQSVPGGWQTRDERTGKMIGPVFNSVNDLWAWQSANPQEKPEPALMIYHHTDWKGEKHMVRVAGMILASYPSEHIYLVQTLFDGFRVYYGLQETEHETMNQAIDEFSDCIKHALEYDANQV